MSYIANIVFLSGFGIGISKESIGIVKGKYLQFCFPFLFGNQSDIDNVLLSPNQFSYLESLTSGHRKGRTSTALPKTNFIMADNLLQRLSNRFIWIWNRYS